ncbi:hypothetical protein AAY473_014453 [Plecturocebus cupreus]
MVLIHRQEMGEMQGRDWVLQSFGQAGLELLTSGDPPTLASQSPDCSPQSHKQEDPKVHWDTPLQLPGGDSGLSRYPIVLATFPPALSQNLLAGLQAIMPISQMRKRKLTEVRGLAQPSGAGNLM